MTINIAPEGVEITKRFFLALETLKTQKKIRGLRTFTEKYNLNYWNFATLKSDPTKRLLKVEYLYYLVNDYGVSADWLITGNGNIFKSTKR